LQPHFCSRPSSLLTKVISQETVQTVEDKEDRIHG
jgi:hypothetical protein